MKQRETYLSLVRIVCAIAVIMIHTNVCFWEFNVGGCWKSANIIESGLAFAVPLFLMISGATLIDYNERYSTKDYFIKRFVKTGIPFIFWSIIGAIYDRMNGTHGTLFIYYFFIYLFSIYICIPLFSCIKKENREKIILGIVIGSFLLNYLVPFIYALFKVEYIFVFPFEIADGYLIYALVGYLISKKDIRINYRIISYIFSIMGFVMYAGGTYLYSMRAGVIDETFRGYKNLPCLLMSVGLFIFFKEVGRKIKNEKLIRVIENVSKYTFSVYLIHYYVIYIVIQNLFTNHHSLYYRLGTPFLTFVICVGIAWLVKKIPIINKILP